MKITKKQFKAYEAVRESGVTHMFDIRMVSQLSGLKKAEILEIMKNYSELKEQYEDKIKGSEMVDCLNQAVLRNLND